MAISIVRALNPWKYRREEMNRRVTALRQRDGDQCTRCRKPLRFDLPPGHDRGPRIEPRLPAGAGGDAALDNLCLTHGRCNAAGNDDTAQVKERARIKNEAALFVRARERRRA